MTTVPARASARQPKPHTTELQLSALWLVSVSVIHGVTGLDLAWTVIVIVVLVVIPAAWPSRRWTGLGAPGHLPR